MGAAQPKPAPSKTVADTKTCLTQMVLYPQTDAATGLAKPGVITYLADDTAFVTALKFSEAKRLSTVNVSEFRFLADVHFHDLLTCTAHVTAVGKTSMLIQAVVEAWAPPYHQSRRVASGDFVYVVTAFHQEGDALPTLTAHNQAEAETLQQGQARLAEIKATPAPPRTTPAPTG